MSASDSGSTRPWLGRKFGDLRLERVLGGGRWTISYMASFVSDPTRRAVIKVLRSEIASHERARKRFVAEIERTEAIQGEGLVPQRLFESSDLVAPAVMRPWIDAPSLAHSLERPLGSATFVLALARRLATALGRLHAAGVLHRSLAPTNVFLGPNESASTAQLTDAGLTRALDALDSDALEPPPAALLPYLAPEQRRYAPLDLRADLYALGAVLYHLLSGRPPALNQPELDVEAVTSRLPETPHAFVRLVERLLAPNPAERPQSAHEVLATLSRIERTASTSAFASAAGAGRTQAIRLGAIPRGSIRLPGGTFRRGRDDRHKDQRPVRTVRVEAFSIDKHPVTHAQYAEFLRAISALPDPHRFCHPDEPPNKDHTPGLDALWAKPFAWARRRPPAGLESTPVVLVDWFDAFAYAAWAGARLPTEAEWEYAAGGRHDTPYPWGHTPPTAQHASFAGRDNTPTPPDMRPLGKSPEGVEDLLGNVWEWVQDLYDPRYYPTGPTTDPCNESSGHQRVARGGSFRTPREALDRFERGHFDPLERALELGFRCVRDDETEDAP